MYNISRHYYIVVWLFYWVVLVDCNCNMTFVVQYSNVVWRSNFNVYSGTIHLAANLSVVGLQKEQRHFRMKFQKCIQCLPL